MWLMSRLNGYILNYCTLVYPVCILGVYCIPSILSSFGSFQFIFLTKKSADFCLFNRPENWLISARILCWKNFWFHWFQLSYRLENRRFSAAFLCLKINYSTSSVSSTATDYQHSRRAVLAWAVGPCGLVLKGLKDSTRRYANYAVVSVTEGKS